MSNKPDGSPDRPTVRPRKPTQAGPAVVPKNPTEQLDMKDVEVLEQLVGTAEQGMDHLAPALESGRPPEEPPRALPTIGNFGDYAIVGRLALGAFRVQQGTTQRTTNPIRLDVKGATPDDNFRSRFDPVEMISRRSA